MQNFKIFTKNFKVFIYITKLTKSKAYNWPSNSVGTPTKLNIQKFFKSFLSVQFRPFSHRISTLDRFSFPKFTSKVLELTFLWKALGHLLLMMIFSGFPGYKAYIKRIKDVHEVEFTFNLHRVSRRKQFDVIYCNKTDFSEMETYKYSLNLLHKTEYFTVCIYGRTIHYKNRQLKKQITGKWS